MTEWRHERLPQPWGRLSVYTAGEGPPLLLLHGLGGSGRYWAGLAPHLASRRTLIAPDLAGFGRSDKPHASYDSAFHVEALAALLEARGLPVASVAGHSMGGVLAALLAARHPRLVDRLAVVASPFPRPQERPLRLPTSPPGRAVFRFIQTVLPLLAPLVRSATFPREVVADYLRHTLESYTRTSQHILWDGALAAEVRSLSSAPPPALLLFSGADTTIHPDSLAQWRGALPTAVVEVVPGGHQLLLRGGFARLAAWVTAGAGTVLPPPVVQTTHTAL
ncbi:MAG: alpha/beta fold hydrolase [Candidatus Dormibacteria bacterium]